VERKTTPAYASRRDEMMLMAFYGPEDRARPTGRAVSTAQGTRPSSGDGGQPKNFVPPYLLAAFIPRGGMLGPPTSEPKRSRKEHGR